MADAEYEYEYGVDDWIQFRAFVDRFLEEDDGDLNNDEQEHLIMAVQFIKETLKIRTKKRVFTSLSTKNFYVTNIWILRYSNEEREYVDTYSKRLATSKEVIEYINERQAEIDEMTTNALLQGLMEDDTDE